MYNDLYKRVQITIAKSLIFPAYGAGPLTFKMLISTCVLFLSALTGTTFTISLPLTTPSENHLLLTPRLQSDITPGTTEAKLVSNLNGEIQIHH